MSIGMATLEEVVHALGVARDAGAEDIILLRCTSSYPASDASMRLATIPLLAEVGSCLSGLSDHSLGITAPTVAVTLGACLVEKHLTLNRSERGIDSHFSLEPAEFEALVKEVRRAEAMIGAPCFGPGLEEEGSVSFRRSLYLTEDVNTGDKLTIENVRSIRPGFGISPRYLDLMLGRRVSRAATRGTPLSWDLVFP